MWWFQCISGKSDALMNKSLVVAWTYAHCIARTFAVTHPPFFCVCRCLIKPFILEWIIICNSNIWNKSTNHSTDRFVHDFTIYRIFWTTICAYERAIATRYFNWWKQTHIKSIHTKWNDFPQTILLLFSKYKENNTKKWCSILKMCTIWY